MSPFNLILLGAPGSGKGVQCEFLLKHYGLAHISTGNILRQEVAAESDLGIEAKLFMDKGLYVPDELIFRILEKELASKKCSKGFILDGVPRTLAQAEALDDIMTKQNKSLSKAINLEVREQTLVSRIVNRRSCLKCGRVYNLIGMPPKTAGKCDDCQTDLFHRADDNEETVRKRFAEYESKTKQPLVDFYTRKGILLSLDGEIRKEDLFQMICNNLDMSNK